MSCSRMIQAGGDNDDIRVPVPVHTGMCYWNRNGAQ